MSPLNCIMKICTFLDGTYYHILFNQKIFVQSFRADTHGGVSDTPQYEEHNFFSLEVTIPAILYIASIM